MIRTLRLLVAEWFLHLALIVAPNGNEKIWLAKSIRNYIRNCSGYVDKPMITEHRCILCDATEKEGHKPGCEIKTWSDASDKYLEKRRISRI